MESKPRPKKPLPPISDEMKAGKAPLRSFGDLLQFFELKHDAPDGSPPAAPAPPAAPVDSKQSAQQPVAEKPPVAQETPVAMEPPAAQEKSATVEPPVAQEKPAAADKSDEPAVGPS
jgi:hypothetical protein